MRAQLQKILNDMEPEGLWYHYVVSIYDNLTDIGFDPSSNSFRYALDAILLAHTSQLSIHAIYAAVGHILGVSPQQVKNGIRENSQKICTRPNAPSDLRGSIRRYCLHNGKLSVSQFILRTARELVEVVDNTAYILEMQDAEAGGERWTQTP